MGKYIFSYGKNGLWEESRPLVMPLILGIGWKLGNAILFGRLVSIVFAALAVYMTYKIGLKIFSKNIGLLAAFFLSFSFNFLFFSSRMLTEIPSLFFVLLAMYFFIDSKFFLTGLFSGIAVMTRFFQVFALIGLYVVFLSYFFPKNDFVRKLFNLLTGFLLLIVPYFLLNYYLYGDLFLPLKVQSHLTQTTGWMLYENSGFYFTGLLKENFLMIFLLSAPFFLKRNYRFYAVLFIPLIYILIFSVVKHKEMRFMITIFPFLYMLTAYYIHAIHKKMKTKVAVKGFFLVLIILWITITFSAFNSSVSYNENNEAIVYFQNYLKNNNLKSWVTNPLYALYSKNRIDGLVYYYSPENLVMFVEKNKENVDVVLYNECDIPCQSEDKSCLKSRDVLRNALSNLKKIYEKSIDSCRYQIFTAT